MRASAKALGVGQLAALGLSVALLSAQQEPPTFRTATRLVEIAVTVLDSKGNAVAGLAAADFVVLDEGKPRPVELFSFDGARAGTTPGAAATPGAATAPPPGVFTNRPSAGAPAARSVTALVLDNINTTPLQGVTARAQAMQYLRQLAPQTVVAVYLLASKLFVLHDFTDDAVVLRGRLEAARLPAPTAWETDVRQSVVEAEAFVRMFPEDQALAVDLMRNKLRVDAMADAAIRRDRLERSLAQIEALGAHLAGIPGRKSLIWIGGGFSMAAVTATTAGQRQTPELLETSEKEVREVSRRLAQQGIVLYIVDAHYLESPSDSRPATRMPVPQSGRGNFELLMDVATASNDVRPAMQTMASITGGRYFYPNDVTSGVDKVLSDLQGSYTLGFYMRDEPDGKWHKLRVQVKRAGLSVRHREGYLADPNAAQSVKWTEETWRSAISSPLASPAIPLTATCKWTAFDDMSVTVLADTDALEFRPDGKNLKADLEILFGDRTAEGVSHTSRSTVASTVAASDWETARLQPTRIEAIWKPTAEATAVRVIVHDVNSGRYGSLDVPLSKVPRQSPH